jgi:hypothetical protein
MTTEMFDFRKVGDIFVGGTVAARGPVGRSAFGRCLVNHHLVNPVLDVSHANICEIVN